MARSITFFNGPTLIHICVSSSSQCFCFSPLQTDLPLLSYIIDRAPDLWNRAVNQSVELDVAWSLANCLEVVVGHRVGLIPSGLNWPSVLHELNKVGVDWTKLVRTCW